MQRYCFFLNWPKKSCFFLKKSAYLSQNRTKTHKVHKKKEKSGCSRKIEVDAIIGNAKIAIEIKSTEDVQNKHLKGLRAFADEYPECRKIIVALDRISRTTDDGIEIMYVYDFLKQLWDGMLF